MEHPYTARGLAALFPILSLVLLGCLTPSVSSAQTDATVSLGVESGILSVARNDVRIPGDSGTRYDMSRLTGDGPEPFVRLEVRWAVSSHHGLKLVLAPFELQGDGQFEDDVLFAGTRFPAGTTNGRYRFDTYRLTYRYALSTTGRWRWGVGFTAAVRDAEVTLRQGERVGSDDNVGFVPALHLSGRYRWNERWSLQTEFDGLAGGPGRFLEGSVALAFEPSPRWQVHGGYRALEGGADTDEVFNFAWFNFLYAGIRYRL